ncbi:adenylyl-sulfate kinase [Vulgatibacter sp.]|uniref:adenylyl-sulfate kinase n=1 Tax=Vulgatibacter sp. TaxID=1971226 RepID=UPI00356B0D55
MEMQPGFTLWLTGMSGAGKSTLARYIASRLPLIGRRVELLDGPEVEALFPEVPRASAKEQLEHSTRSLGWAAKLLTRNGVIAIVTSLSPYKESREEVRKAIGRFVEVEVNAPWEQLVERDHRGFYKRGTAGEITDIIGYHEPYETNTNPEIKVDTGTTTDEEKLGAHVFERLFSHGFLSRKERDVLINGGTLDFDDEDEAEVEQDAEEARAELIERRVAAEAAARAAAAGEAKSGAKAVKPAKAAKVARAKAAPVAAPAPEAKAPKAARQAVAKAAAPAKPAAPAKAVAAVKGEKPAKAQKAAAVKTAPVKKAAPAPAPAPAKKPVKAAAPVKAAKPAKAAPPARTAKPTRAAAPAKAAKPAKVPVAPAKVARQAKAAKVARPAARAASKPAAKTAAKAGRTRR